MVAEAWDFVLIQGDFGATWIMVNHAFKLGLVPCDEAESEYQESLTRLKMRAKTATPPPSPATQNEVSKPSTAMVAKAGPSKEVWPSANLTWDPGPGILTANSPKGKATTKDKDLIPESIQARLFKKGKKKSVVAEVEVEPRGNGFNIVTIKV